MSVYNHKKWFGVNLGGWLVLERWMDPGLFQGLKAQDETQFCLELGDQAEGRLKKHWESFIRPEDFDWLVAQGINTVRLPIGHWIFGDRPPYVGSIDILDEIMHQLADRKLAVVLDLHTAPGCQNGFDNGGMVGVMEWHKHPENIERTLESIERISERYRHHPTLVGIELLNEPHHEIDLHIVQDYYLQGYERVRKYIPPEKAAVVIHDSFRSLAWEGFMQEPDYQNVVLDTHIYQCFTEHDRALDPFGHIQRALEHQVELDAVQKQLPTIVGEWSLGLPERARQGLDELNHALLLKAYGSVQQMNYNRCQGWFFWSYRVKNGRFNGWDFRAAVENGYLLAPSALENAQA